MTSYSRSKIFLAVLLTALVAVYCSENEFIPAAPSVDLSVEIIAGPAAGGTVANNANFTFAWRIEGGGEATFTYKLDGVDASAVTTSDFSKSYPGQTAGSYTFTVTATGGSESSSDTRTFTVGASLFNPSVTISGPRGSASSGGSGITPDYAPGSLVRLSWVGFDEDPFGSIVSYRYKTTDAGTYSELTLGTAAGFPAPAAGSHTFTVETTDNTGATSTTTFIYNTKAPEIMIVDDWDQIGVNEAAGDQYFVDIFDGFSISVVDVAAEGFTTALDPAVTKIVVWYGNNSSVLGDTRNGASTILPDYLDGGGKLWAMGQGIAEDINNGSPPDANDFNAKYLHISTSDGTTDRAGEFDGSQAFSFAIDELGNPDDFPKMKMGALSAGDVDQVFPGTGAEVVYSGLDGLDVGVGNVALRFPEGNTGTVIFYMTFPLFDTANNIVLPAVSSILVNTIMIAMGQ